MAIKQLEKRAIDVLLSLGELSNKYSENLVMSEKLSSYIFSTQHSASSNVSLKDFVRSHKVGDIQQRHDRWRPEYCFYCFLRAVILEL